MPVWAKLGLLGGFIGLLVGWHVFSKHNAVERALEAQKAIYNQKVAEEVERAQETTVSLLNSALEDLQKKEDENKIIRNQLSVLNSKLQQRTSREDSSSAPGNPGTCTGAELFREDGEFLAREAARADRILKERDFYYEQYKRAREALASHKGADGR